MMKKFNRQWMGNSASVLLYAALDEGFTRVEPDLQAVEQVELAAMIQRACDEGRKTITIHLSTPKPAK